MDHVRRWWVWIGCLGLLMASGCSSQGDGDLEATLISKLRSCDLLSEGPFSIPMDGGDECYMRCVADASCHEIQEALCAPWDEQPPLEARCDAQCAFTCNDGTEVPWWLVCDGEPHCAGGEDEAGCSMFVCNDGTEIPEYLVCSGWESCAGGEDEAGCPTFTCSDGTEIPEWAVCDGFVDCPDGEDEEGCAELTPMCHETGV